MRDPYKMQGTDVLQNLYGIRDKTILDAQEREATTQRMSEELPRGDFGATHVAAIHRHLFQDVYAWAGEFRTVPMSKAGDAFAEPGEIPQKLASLGKEIRGIRNKWLIRPVR